MSEMLVLLTLLGMVMMLVVEVYVCNVYVKWRGGMPTREVARKFEYIEEY